MSDSVRPHGLQPTRLPRPWDSPGKNTGVGCHFLLQCMKVESESEVAQSCPTLATPWTAAYQAPPSMGFSGQQYWSGVPLLRCYFSTNWPIDLYNHNKVSKQISSESESHSDSLPAHDYTVHGILQARIQEWVVLPLSRESSQSRDRTQVSHIAGKSLPAEPQGKRKNIGVGSLSLLHIPT